MGPNDVELVRVFTREVDAPVADITFPYTSPFEVVVDAEVGSSLHGTGGQFEVGVIVRDLTTGGVLTSAVAAIPNTPPPGASANFGSAPWSNPGNQKFVYRIQRLPRFDEDHICEVLAWLRVGIQNPDVSFARSPLFIIQRR